MRLEKVGAALALAKELASDPEGMTIQDIGARFNISRRTAERMRDIIDTTFGPLERIEDGRRVRFRIASGGLNRFALTPTAEEMAELLNIARSMKVRDPARAVMLESLAAKIGAALRPPDRRRLAPDIELHLETEIWVHTSGPRVACASDVLKAIREALLRERKLRVEYRKVAEDVPRSYDLVPFGIVFGAGHYLVAGFSGKESTHLLRLDRIISANVSGDIGRRPIGFDLKDYAERSFGHFQEKPETIELVFHPHYAKEAEAFQFHPRQIMDTLANGSLSVRFEAGGLKELADQLRRWRGTFEVASPKRLRRFITA